MAEYLGLTAVPAVPVTMIGDVPIPVDVPLPLPPISLPDPGPIITFIGKGEHAVWDNVWDWVKNKAAPAAGHVIQGEIGLGQDIINAVESYGGHLLQSVSGFINQAYDFASMLANDVNTFAIDVAIGLSQQIQSIDGEIGGIIDEIYSIDQIIVPGLEGEIKQLGIDALTWTAIAADGVKSWAIDHISDPLAALIEGVNADIRADVHDGLTRVLSEAESFTNRKVATLAAEVASLAVAVDAVTTFVDNCGEPMCQTMGPNTPLGKLLKGLALAANAALLAAVLDMNEQELADAVTAMIGKFGNIVGDFEDFFAPGGEKLSHVVTAVLGQAL